MLPQGNEAPSFFNSSRADETLQFESVAFGICQSRVPIKSARAVLQGPVPRFVPVAVIHGGDPLDRCRDDTALGDLVVPFPDVPYLYSAH